MSQGLPSFEDHDQGVLEALVLVGEPVGHADGTGLAVPHVVMYPMPGGSRDGSMSRPEDDAELIYQLTCTSDSPRGCRWLADRADAAIRATTVVGRHVVVRTEMQSGVVRDTDKTPHLFYTTPRYRLYSTPAP